MSSYIPAELRRFVVARSNGCCEYCLMGADDAFFPHEIDHIRAEKHRGITEESNLCYSCYDCNRHKGTDLSSVDPETDEITLIFNPRRDVWVDHFELEGAFIVPLTAIGRTTVALLQFNTPVRLAERQVLFQIGRYPCR